LAIEKEGVGKERRKVNFVRLQRERVHDWKRERDTMIFLGWGEESDSKWRGKFEKPGKGGGKQRPNPAREMILEKP